MERGREGEGRANKQWNFIWARQSLSFSLSVSVSVSCSGPLLLSQADFIAGPWPLAKQANSMTMCACICVCICPCMQLTARKCVTSLEATQTLKPFCLYAMLTSHLHLFISLFLILLHRLLFHRLDSLIFPFFVQSKCQPQGLKN